MHEQNNHTMYAKCSTLLQCRELTIELSMLYKERDLRLSSDSINYDDTESMNTHNSTAILALL